MQWPIEALKLVNEGLGSSQVKVSMEECVLNLLWFLKRAASKILILKKNKQTGENRAHANSLTQTQTRAFL